MLNKSALSVAITAALSFSVFASDNIEHITVTANKFEQPLDDALSAITVINRTTIEQSNVRDVVSLLDSVAGVQVVRNGGFGQTVSLYLRGNDAKHTLVLMDGVRITDANSGSASLTNIPLNSIERIEVIRGAKAAMYGSDAIAGVINIVSREGNYNVLAATTGSHNYSNVEGVATLKHNALTISTNVGYEHTDGYDVIEKDPAKPIGKDHDTDGYYNANAGVNIKYGDVESGLFNLRSQYSEGEGEYDNAWGSDEYRFENYTHNLTWQRRTDKFSQKASYSLGKEQNKQQGSPNDNNAYVTKRSQFEYLSQFHFNDALLFSGNLTLLNEDVSASSATFSQTERDNQSLSLGAFFNDQNWLAEVVLRSDDYDFHGRANTYTLAVGKQLTEQLSVKVNHGTAFRAPSLTNAFTVDNPYYLPNPAIKPEEATNNEVILTYSESNWRVQTALYDNRVTDKIVNQYLPERRKYIPGNVDRANFEGIDLSVGVDAFDIEHSLEASYTKAEDAKTGTQFSRRAKRTLSYRAYKQWENLDVTLHVQYRGEREEAWAQARLPSYTVFNLAANYQLFDGLKLTARVENLTDKQYTNAIAGKAQDGSLLGYKPLGRQAYVGVNYQF
ncbi:TonB-dependent receptor domain-containing protein [Pseudoalteromonas sp. T1lg65]|uniref:TonB-dependent receptor domain-containing protein n=1 Tax=Pseudoalteromonas sp. T1lg65 TaxID=2077101 RepID=UPI003F7A17ED